jgi:hypothetical protein
MKTRNPVYYGASFTSDAFLNIVAKSNRELNDAVPSKAPTEDDPNPDRKSLPNASCEGMYALADMFDELEHRGISASQYVEGLQMSAALEQSPFIIRLRLDDGLHLLADSIQKRDVVNYMMHCYAIVVRHENVEISLLYLSFLEVAILSNMIRWHIEKAMNKDERAFVDSLPVFDVATVSRGDMRCAHC